jgi:hypothetical protein
MYSVIRFTLPKERAHELLPIGARIDERQPGAFTGLRRAGDGFACDVSRAKDWTAHVAAARELVGLHAEVIRDAVSIGARVTLDVALGDDDRRASSIALSIVCPPDLLRLLGEANVVFVVSVY